MWLGISQAAAISPTVNFPSQHQLHHAEPQRMRQGPQALGGLLESSRIEQFGRISCSHAYIIS